MIAQKQKRVLPVETYEVQTLIALARAGEDSAMRELYKRAGAAYVNEVEKAISVNEAADLYGTPTYFWRNAIRMEYVAVIKAGSDGRGNVSEMDRRDVAVFWELYQILKNEGYLLRKVYRTIQRENLIAA